MYKLVCAVGFAFGLALTGARAETAAELMKKFGLEGIWSPDCAGALRVQFVIPAAGPPTLTGITEGRETSAYEIREANLLGENQLLLKSVVTRFESHARPALTPQPGEVWEAVYQKEGPKYRVLSARQSKGSKITALNGVAYEPKLNEASGSVTWHPTGQPTRVFEKCPN